MPMHLPFGSWPSSITAQDVAAGTKPLGGACFYGERIIVQEGRPLKVAASPWSITTATAKLANSWLMPRSTFAHESTNTVERAGRSSNRALHK